MKKIKRYTRLGSFSLKAFVASGVDVKIVIFPRAPGRCYKNKTKTTRSEAIDCADGSVLRQSDLYIPVPVFVARVPL